MTTIEVADLKRDYGGGRGVFGVSFEVNEGEVFGFLGPNGAGKTTTIRHLMGFLKPQQGHCAISGADCWSQSAQIQRDLGYVPGELNTFDDVTGTEFLHFVARYRGMSGLGRTNELLERFDLDPNARLRKMSKGTKQKVGIVAALMHDPAVLIFDEPTSGLDPLMQSRFIELVADERASGKTILLSSHQFEEVERTCHRVSIIRKGQLVAVNSIDDLKAKQLRRYIVTFATDADAERFSSEGFHVDKRQENHVTVTVGTDLQRLLGVLATYPVENLSAPNLSLEEVFMQFYGGSDNA